MGEDLGKERVKETDGGRRQSVGKGRDAELTKKAIKIQGNKKARSYEVTE